MKWSIEVKSYLKKNHEKQISFRFIFFLSFFSPEEIKTLKKKLKSRENKKVTCFLVKTK